ncbi:hypothetical protein NMG60_11026361 [Bertholletia excelsa]
MATYHSLKHVQLVLQRLKGSNLQLLSDVMHAFFIVHAVWFWSRSRSGSRSRSRATIHGRTDAINAGNTLYVTGLSTRVGEREVEDHFSKDGKVASCFLVVEPLTRYSCAFAFITMDTVDDANRCIKHLHQSVLDGRNLIVERSRRKRARTPPPGYYLGPKSTREYGYRGDCDRYHGGHDGYGYRSSPRRTPHQGGRDYSPWRSACDKRSRRERLMSLPYSPRGSPDRNYYRRHR